MVGLRLKPRTWFRSTHPWRGSEPAQLPMEKPRPECGCCASRTSGTFQPSAHLSTLFMHSSCRAQSYKPELILPFPIFQSFPLTQLGCVGTRGEGSVPALVGVGCVWQGLCRAAALPITRVAIKAPRSKPCARLRCCPQGLQGQLSCFFV